MQVPVIDENGNQVFDMHCEYSFTVSFGPFGAEANRLKAKPNKAESFNQIMMTSPVLICHFCHTQMKLGWQNAKIYEYGIKIILLL